MKIKCTKLIDKETGISKIADDWVIVGKTYDVVYLLFNFGVPKKYGIKFQIAVDGEIKNNPALLDESDFFEIVDSTIPSNMGIFMDIEAQKIVIKPRSFEEYKSTREEWSDFWNDFYEGERSAIELYRKEVAFIKGIPYSLDVDNSHWLPDRNGLLVFVKWHDKQERIVNLIFPHTLISDYFYRYAQRDHHTAKQTVINILNNLQDPFFLNLMTEATKAEHRAELEEEGKQYFTVTYERYETFNGSKDYRKSE